MKKGFFLVITTSIMLLTSIAGAAQLEAINFFQENETSKVELAFDQEDVIANRFHVADDKQIIVDLKNVVAKERIIRSFDTSEFTGSIVFVSAYPKPESPNDLRVAIQLRDNVRSIMDKLGKKIIINVENRFGVFSQNNIEKGKSFEEKINEEGIGRYNVPKSTSVEDILDNLTMSGRKKYIGKRISINMKSVSVENILKMIANTSGFNIIFTSEVKKLDPLTLNLTDIPWDQALDTILGINKLVASKNGSILVVTTLDKATLEKRKEIEARKLSQKEVPLVTKLFPISYSSLKEMSDIIKEYLTPERGKISLDERTNTIILKDTADVIEKIRKIVELLDTQTPQVLIESKIVEVTEQYTKEIGLQNGINFGYDPIGSLSAERSVVGGDITAGTDAGPGFKMSSAPVGGESARSLFGLTVTRFGRLVDLNFSLQLMESESKGKVVASPKVITQNKKPAELVTSDTTSYAVITGTGESQTRTYDKVSAQLSLKVTPQVTNEGSIVLEVDLSKDQFGVRPGPNAPPDVATRHVKTNVLVDNGSTIVIGGIYNYQKSETHSGIPFLKDIPLIGWLFRTAYNPEMKKNELIIFLTPRIINQKEAGLTN